MTDREEGFYWLRSIGDDGRRYAWQIGEWIPDGLGEVSQAHWIVAGIAYLDSGFEIGPRIEPPSQSGHLVKGGGW